MLKARGVCHRCYQRRRTAGDLTKTAPVPVPRTSIPYVDGLSYRQLDYWTSKGYLRPENPSPGSGGLRSWSDAEIAIARTMVRLVGAGLTVIAASRVARGDCEIAPGVRVLVEVTP